MNERHFSYYAFNGANGVLRWKHDSMVSSARTGIRTS